MIQTYWQTKCTFAYLKRKDFRAYYNGCKWMDAIFHLKYVNIFSILLFLCICYGAMPVSFWIFLALQNSIFNYALVGHFCSPGFNVTYLTTHWVRSRKIKTHYAVSDASSWLWFQIRGNTSYTITSNLQNQLCRKLSARPSTTPQTQIFSYDRSIFVCHIRPKQFKVSVVVHGLD